MTNSTDSKIFPKSSGDLFLGQVGVKNSTFLSSIKNNCSILASV